MTDEPQGNSQDQARVLLAEVMQGVAESDRQLKQVPKSPRSSTPMVVVLSAALVAVVGWNVYSLGAARHAEVFSRDEAKASARVMLALATQSVRTFRETKGRLPASIADIGYQSGDGVSYGSDGEHYHVTVTTATDTLTWRDGDPVEDARELLERMRRPGSRR